MQISATGKGPQGGFTLLELVVVVLLIGLLAGTATLQLSPPADSPLQNPRLALHRLSERLLEQAVLQNRSLALQLTAQGQARSLAYGAGGWEVVVLPQLPTYQLPAELSWTLQQGDSQFQRSNSSDAPLPQILFSPDGLVSPFHLRLSWPPHADQTLTDAIFYVEEADIASR